MSESRALFSSSTSDSANANAASLPARRSPSTSPTTNSAGRSARSSTPPAPNSNNQTSRPSFDCASECRCTNLANFRLSDFTCSVNSLCVKNFGAASFAKTGASAPAQAKAAITDKVQNIRGDRFTVSSFINVVYSKRSRPMIQNRKVPAALQGLALAFKLSVTLDCEVICPVRHAQ